MVGESKEGKYRGKEINVSRDFKIALLLLVLFIVCLFYFINSITCLLGELLPCEAPVVPTMQKF